MGVALLLEPDAAIEGVHEHRPEHFGARVRTSVASRASMCRLCGRESLQSTAHRKEGSVLNTVG